MKRREAIKNTILGSGALIMSNKIVENLDQFNSKNGNSALSNTVKHSACRWCYSKIPLESFIESCQDLGVRSIELLDPEEYKIVIGKGLECAIANSSSLHITKGFNDPTYHSQLTEDYHKLILSAAENGVSQVICFSGNRNNLSDEQGLENCAKGLDNVVKLAEKYNITLVMELLNSKVDHHGYQCDNTGFGTALVDKIGSAHFKLLYDIYHMQIMEGDVISTIRKYNDYISHYHTGGVPGRKEINETQELNYKAIIKAIMETGYQGFIAQEFIPSNPDPIASLKEGIQICNVI
ncbi:MAG: TIM barrel protein [Saprospiraceae bacterium]|nr:TIM barrel protein [Saprospiraceae bacterium]